MPSPLESECNVVRHLLRAVFDGMFRLVRVAVEIVKICYEVGDWEGLNANVVLLSKRRQQLKQVLVDIVQVILVSPIA